MNWHVLPIQSIEEFYLALSVYLILPDIATLVSTCEVNLHTDRSVNKAFAIDVILYKDNTQWLYSRYIDWW